MFNSKYKQRLLFVLIVFTFIFIIFSKSVNAYELDCQINITSLSNEDKLVTTKSFFPNITFTNIGNNNFPEALVNVTIFNPNHEIIEDYYSFKYSFRNISINQSTSFVKPWINYLTNKSGYTLFELQMPGTWEIDVKLVNLPQDEVTVVNSDYIQRIGECRKYFSVEEISTYQFEKTMDTFNKELKDFTVVLVIIAFLSLLVTTYPIIKDHKETLVAYLGLFSAMFTYNIFKDNMILVLGQGVILVLSLIFLFQKKWIKNNKVLFTIYIILVLLNSAVLFQLFFEMLKTNMIISVVGLLWSIILMISALYALNEEK